MRIPFLEAKRDRGQERGRSGAKMHLQPDNLGKADCALQDEEGVSHLQFQGRPLSCLNTCQAATSSLDPQEDGHLGAVQASVRKDTDFLWEVRQERDSGNKWTPDGRFYFPCFFFLSPRYGSAKSSCT